MEGVGRFVVEFDKRILHMLQTLHSHSGRVLCRILEQEGNLFEKVTPTFHPHQVYDLNNSKHSRLWTWISDDVSEKASSRELN